MTRQSLRNYILPLQSSILFSVSSPVFIEFHEIIFKSSNVCQCQAKPKLRRFQIQEPSARSIRCSHKKPNHKNLNTENCFQIALIILYAIRQFFLLVTVSAHAPKNSYAAMVKMFSNVTKSMNCKTNNSSVRSQLCLRSRGNQNIG